MSQEMIVGDPRSVLATISRPELVNLLLVESRERAKKRIREIQSIQDALMDQYEARVRAAYGAWVDLVEARVASDVKLPKGHSWGAWLNVPSVQKVTVEKTRARAGTDIGHLWYNYAGELFAGGIKGIDLRRDKKVKVKDGLAEDPIPSCYLSVYFNEMLFSPEDSKVDPYALQQGIQTHIGVLKGKRSWPLPESIILWREVKVVVKDDSRVASITFHMPIPIKMDLTIPKDTLADLKGIMDQVYSLRAEAAGLHEFCHEKGTPEQERALLAALTRSALAAEGVSLDFNNLLPPLLTVGETPIK